jgi:hypothetical protein
MVVLSLVAEEPDVVDGLGCDGGKQVEICVGREGNSLADLQNLRHPIDYLQGIS